MANIHEDFYKVANVANDSELQKKTFEILNITSNHAQGLEQTMSRGNALRIWRYTLWGKLDNS